MNANVESITLRLYGALRQVVGSREVRVAGDGATVGEVLQQFAQQHGPRAGEMLFDRQGNLWRSLILLLNEEPAAAGTSTSVKAGDVISVLLPLAGG